MSKTYDINENFTVVTPAHGRDYKSAKAAVADFAANLHFIHAATGRVCSRSNFAPGLQVNIRYKQLRSVTTYVIPADS